MAVKFPGFVQIGAHKIQVVFPHRFEERSDQYAQYDPGMQKIRITDVDSNGSTRPDTDIVRCFVHEVLHAVDDIFGDCKVFAEDKERNLDAIAQGLTQVFLAGQFPVLEDD